MPSRAALCLVSAVAAACASAASGADPYVAQPARVETAEPVAAAAPTTTAAPTSTATPAPESGDHAAELAVWRDPAFRQRFAESYLAETEVEPRITEVERERMQEVLERMSADRLDEALQLLNKNRGPAASAVLDFTAGNLHFQQERLPQARIAYDVALEKYPKFLRAWKNLGLVLVREGDFAGAAQAFTRVLELGQGDAATYGLLGFCHGNQENHLAAESAYRMANLLDPDTLDWKMGMARSFFKQARYAEAAALCGSLIEDQPERSDLWLLQANAYIGLGQPLRAAENFELVGRLGGATVESLNGLGDIYTNEGLFDLAVDSYLAALETSDGAGIERALRAARVLTAQGALGESRRLAQRIEELRGASLADEDRIELLKLRARLAVAEGAGDEEAAVLREVVALDPLDGDALILLGQHAARSGDVEQAVFYYERAAAIEDFEADAKVRHAQLLVGQRRYAEALALLRRAQALRPRETVQTYIEDVERVSQGR